MQKTGIIAIIIFMLFQLDFFSQNFSYPNVVAKTVSFSGDLVIKKDDYYNSKTNYVAPQWTSTNTIQSPVAYVSGVAPTVSATFMISCANVPTSVMIKGTSSDTTIFAPKAATISGSTFTYPATKGSKVFKAGLIRYFKSYVINWEFSFDGGITWKGSIPTSNTLYVTKATPYTVGGVTCNYETVFYLSCKNANLQTLDTAIISHAWSEFTDQILLNCKGDSLHYYKNWSCPNVTLATMLCYRDGECYTFAYLFLAMLKVQGIALTNNYVYVDSNYSTFLVKNYTFSNLVSANTYSSKTDLIGVGGMCKKDPPSNFNNHGIAKINGVYYDPSYGVIYGKSINDMKSALDAFSSNNKYYTNLTVGTLKEQISTY